MRVAMVGFDAGEYGVQLCSALADHAEVLLVAPRDRAEPHASKLDPRVRTMLFDLPRMREPHLQAPAMAKTMRAIARFRPDVVHLQHSHFYFSALSPLFKRWPFVVTVHDPVHHVGDSESQKTPQRLVHYSYRRADQLITHADQLKNVMVDDLHLPADRITVIPHIAQSTGSPVDGVVEDPRMVLFFGRIWEYKGLEYLIKAEPLISERIPDVRIVIAGRGEDLDRYRAMMVHPERFVVDNGYIADEQVARYFQESAVSVLPYIDASQSGVIPVSYSFERPVIATNVGGLPAMVDDGVTGFLVPPRDADAIAKAVVTVLEDDELRHRMGKAGKRKLDTECAPEVVGPAHIKVYERALAWRGRRPR
jgi:starch synthase